MSGNDSDAHRRALEADARDIGRTIQACLPKGVGFALLLFDFGPGGTMSWLSNAQRADMIRALREMIVRLEGS